MYIHKGKMYRSYKNNKLSSNIFTFQDSSLYTVYIFYLFELLNLYCKIIVTFISYTMYERFFFFFLLKLMTRLYAYLQVAREKSETAKECLFCTYNIHRTRVKIILYCY